MAKKSKVNQQKIKEFLTGKEAVKSEMVVLVVLLVFILGYFFVLPTRNSYKENKIDIEDLEKEREILITKKNRLQSLEKEIEQNKDFIEKVKDVVPVEREIPESLVVLEKIARDNSLFISSFKPTELSSDEQRQRISISGKKEGSAANILSSTELQFDLYGNYEGFVGFLKDLEKNIRPYDIKLIRVSGGGQTTKGTRDPLKYSVTAFTYNQPE